MLLTSSVSNSELHLVLSFSNSFGILLACSFIISVVMLISFCFILFFSTLNSLNHSAFLSCSFSLSHLLLQNCLLSSAFGFFISDISYTLLLLINSFLTLDKHSVDHILVHSLFTSLQLCCFCLESLLQPFYTVLTPFFFMLYFFSSFSYFSFLLMSPLW